MSGPLDPATFARLVRESSDEELAAGLAANREVILGEIFRRMPERLDVEAAGALDAVVEWRIGDAVEGEHDAWQVTIAEGRATVEAGAPDKPRVVYTIGAVDFLRLVAGAADGPVLFLRGRLKIRGDLLLAAQMPRLFRMADA